MEVWMEDHKLVFSLPFKKKKYFFLPFSLVVQLRSYFICMPLHSFIMILLCFLLQTVLIFLQYCLFYAVGWVQTLEFWFGKVGSKHNSIIDYTKYCSDIFFCFYCLAFWISQSAITLSLLILWIDIVFLLQGNIMYMITKSSITLTLLIL